MIYTVDDMETFYRIKLIGLIKSVDGVGDVDFDIDIDAGETTVLIETPEFNCKASVRFISETRAMEKFIQESIQQYIKK